MESFAFIVSPITIKQLKSFWSILRIKNLAPFKVLHIKRIKSIQGKEIKGYLNITFIQAGLIKLPYPDRLGIKNGLPKGITYASLAETMLLVLEEKFVDYSLGENVNLDKLEEIADIAVQHGFEVWVPEAPLL